MRARQSRFAGNMAVLVSGSAVSALIGLAATPLLSRLYSPAEYGVFGVFVAALSIFSVIATMRYDRAIPAARNDRDAGSVLIVALGTMLVTSVLCCLLVLSGALGLLMPATREYGRVLAWSLPLGMAATGTYDALSFWMVRRRDFPTLSFTKVAQGASSVGSQIGMGVFGFGAMGLIGGQILGSMMGITRLGRRIRRLDRAAFAEVSVSGLLGTAKQHRRFPLLSAPAVLLDAFTGALPTLVLAHRFGPATAGVFTIVNRVLLAPIALITINISHIYFSELAELHRARSNGMLPLFYRRLRHVALLGAVMIGSMALVVPIVLPTVLGPQWGAASIYFLILSPMIFAGLVSAPFSGVIDVLHRQDLHFLRDSLRAVILIVAVTYAASYDLAALPTLQVISIAGCLNGILYLAISWYALAASPGRLLPDTPADAPRAN
ncbi:MAG: polysaccharide biosynthesis protein [Gemmatimonadetes bacterium]|nr:polysaccharide biosynthesis protein [Gemmatimonadota bacterium]